MKSRGNNKSVIDYMRDIAVIVIASLLLWFLQFMSQINKNQLKMVNTQQIMEQNQNRMAETQESMENSQEEMADAQQIMKINQDKIVHKIDLVSKNQQYMIIYLSNEGFEDLIDYVKAL